MKIETASHRDGENGAKANPYLNEIYSELVRVLESITEDEIKKRFENNSREAKSISQAIAPCTSHCTSGWVAATGVCLSWKNRECS